MFVYHIKHKKAIKLNTNQLTKCL